MKGFNEKDLNDYLTARESRPPMSRLLGGRIFRGTVVSVITGSYNTYVLIQRTEDAALGVTDLTRYACNVPGYVPKKGDSVDLIWRSKDEAVVLGPVGVPMAKFRMFQDGSQTLTSGVWTTLLVGTSPPPDYDPHGGYDAITGLYTIPADGTYTLLGVTSHSGSTGRLGARFIISGVADDERAAIAQMVTNGRVHCTDAPFLLAGDTVGIQIFEDQATGAFTVRGSLIILPHSAP